MSPLFYYGSDAQSAYIRLEGEFRFPWAGVLRQQWPRWQHLIKLQVDLRLCTMLDSTVLGTWLDLQIHQPLECLEWVLLLEQQAYYGAVGLLSVGIYCVEARDTPKSPASLVWETLDWAPASKEKLQEHIVLAHQALSDHQPGNKAEFEELLKLLK